MKTLIAMFFAMFSLAALAEPVTIKGIHLGMSMVEAQKISGFPLPTLESIGGVQNSDEDNSVTEEFDGTGHLVFFLFKFSSSSFNELREALRAKYPKLTCGPGGGICWLNDELILYEDFSGSDGALVLRNKKWMDQKKEDQKKKAKSDL
jgi:hypothetical protein